MGPLLPSSCKRRKQTLPPHGYEGQRAQARQVPAAVLPAQLEVEMPSEEVLKKNFITFKDVGICPGPVRVYMRGQSLGTFISKAHAAATIRRLIRP